MPAGGGTRHPRVRRAADAGGPGRCCRVRLWDGGAGRRNGAAGLPGAAGRTAEPSIHRDAGQRQDHHRAVGRPDAGAGVYRLRRGVPAGVRHHPGGGAAGPRGALLPGAGGSAAPEAFAQNRLCDRRRGRGHPAGGKCGGPAGKRPAVLAAAAAGAAAHRGAAAFHRPAGAVPAAGAAVPGCGGF